MIKSIDLFGEISDEECLDLGKDFMLQYYPRNLVVIREWQKPDKIFILKNWLLEVKKAHGMNSVVLWKINPWEIFGEMSYLKWKDAVASVVVLTDSDIWEISTNKFWKFLDKYPNMMETIILILKKRENENKWKISSWNFKKDLPIEEINIEL